MQEQLREAAEEVFERLGSSWSESVYHRAFERELSERGIPFNSEGTVPVMYRGTPVGRRRPDMFVDCGGSLIVVELKAGSSSGEEQLLQYLDLTTDDTNLDDIRSGMLIKFNEQLEIETYATED